MKYDQWKTYRTRFLVKAKQLSSSLSFTDHLGRQHCGRKGDYLVESCDGVLTITPRQIFEDVYVPMLLETTLDMSGDMSQDMSRGPSCEPATVPVSAIGTNGKARIEPLTVTRIRAQKPRATPGFVPMNPDPTRVRRKSPQPFRPPSTRVGLM
jgi:hypothetical protein